MSRALPVEGLPERLRDGTASEEDRSWAVRRLGVLEEMVPLGLTREQEWELFGLRLLLRKVPA